MIKTILVAAAGSDADDAVFTSALVVARPFSAHLEMLHVRVDAAALAVTMSSEGGGSALVGGLLDRLEKDADRREQRARELFERFCAREGLAVAEAPPGPDTPSAQWSREIGAEPYWMTEYGRAADLIVIGRAADGIEIPSDTIEAALIDSGRPVLIPPATGMAQLPQTVVIAWKATREAAHAVAAASPFLSLSTDIRILTVAEEDDESTEEGHRLMTNLRWRGLQVTAERLRPAADQSPAQLLIAAAVERNALLVMGGYGHTRLREWIFGGFTRHVLETATAVPVLIAH
jgi:nucleotide-binding universal stress UspA family protein